MTIKMRLDTEGLRALIANNPELEIEIGREVMNNIQIDAIKGKIEGQIASCLKGMVQSSGGWNPTYTAKSPELAKAVGAAVDAQIKDIVRERLDAVVSERVGSALRIEREFLMKDVKALLKEFVTPEMARDIMREKLL